MLHKLEMKVARDIGEMEKDPNYTRVIKDKMLNDPRNPSNPQMIGVSPPVHRKTKIATLNSAEFLRNQL